MEKLCIAICSVCAAVSIYSIGYANGSSVHEIEEIPKETITEETAMPTTPEYTFHMEVPEGLKRMDHPEHYVYPVNRKDVEMLACVVYQEAGGDSSCDECRYRVADTVMNRVNDPRFPDSIEGVLLQEGQYGRMHWTGIVWPERAKNECEKHAVERAYKVAEDVLTDKRHSELYGNGYVWQAGFIQGCDNVYHCGTYFGR